ncbi:efflux RND transporter periplasmic adaptor subunit [Parashewanella spongiae]|uniref:Efflux RND transporter periplasmic adaptor subunit n=1 Tax=Parashewanella spongiae TaxID=342950 RepID=A0A3A6U5B7_9GAMM|nr:efflux RND transporter periplasmic adaptor subunit [Parashewanella spongiae]MCL1079052.1 efflux RND transporter periplasmic adaptor subunit [Parashewanella spongiae]RJY11417.1 efflux RND transporter periplasmic adaptor subunit [Parashewanella spongiae]
MKKIIILVSVVIAIIAGVQLTLTEKKINKKQRPMTRVVVEDVTQKKLNDEIEALGSLEARESIIVTSKVTQVVSDINFDDGDMVKKGDLLVQLYNAEQKANVQIATVKLKDSTREFNRIKALVREKSVAELEQDRLITQIETAKAELDSANAEVTDRQVRAPFDGKLGLRNISVGSLLTPSTEITTLDDISTMKLDFSVPERYVQMLMTGKRVEATAVAYPDEVFIGTVKSIDSRIDTSTRAVSVRAELANPGMKLLPGMLMKVKLIKQEKLTIVIPESAIIPRQERHYVYKVNEKDEVIETQVNIGLRKLGIVEITSGLKLGERVITRGILKVRPGDKVKPENEESFSFKRKSNQELSV